MNKLTESIKNSIRLHTRNFILLIITVAGTIVFALYPPLVLEKIVNNLSENATVPLYLVFAYFATSALADVFDSQKEICITVFGQNMTFTIRQSMAEKLKRLPASYFVENDAGKVSSLFVNDVDTLEALFSSGIMSMVVDLFKILTVLFVIFTRSRGLGIILVAAIPVIYIFTRNVQKKMLAAQLENREAIAKCNARIPETCRNIRTIHLYRKEKYFLKKYKMQLLNSFKSLEKSNFYEAVYSPVIIVTSAVIVAVMMSLSRQGGAFTEFFGMSAGTAVAIIAYVGKIFDPIESIGMEIQNIQSAMAGIKRINDFLSQQDDKVTEYPDKETDKSVSVENVTFGYTDDNPIMQNLSLSAEKGEKVTLQGRTGAGKSTIFKLLLGLYEPWQGRIYINGRNPRTIPENEKRKVYGYVEQKFSSVDGSIKDQITLRNSSITDAQVTDALKICGLYDVVSEFDSGIDTPYQESLFSQGQIQLLSVARAIVCNPDILLLDEITANLDAVTEGKVLAALRSASRQRTTLTISHRLFEKDKGRVVTIE